MLINSRNDQTTTAWRCTCFFFIFCLETTFVCCSDLLVCLMSSSKGFSSKKIISFWNRNSAKGIFWLGSFQRNHILVIQVFLRWPLFCRRHLYESQVRVTSDNLFVIGIGLKLNLQFSVHWKNLLTQILGRTKPQNLLTLPWIENPVERNTIWFHWWGPSEIAPEDSGNLPELIPKMEEPPDSLLNYELK